MRKAAGDRVRVYSAGTNPGPTINALSAQVLAEVGGGHERGDARPIDPELLGTRDLVVTLGREAVVEVLPDVEVRSWGTDEPSDAASRALIGCVWSATISTPASRRCSPNWRLLEQDTPKSGDRAVPGRGRRRWL